MNKRTTDNPQDGPIEWKIEFARITGSYLPSFLISYTSDEAMIINQAKAAEALLTRLCSQPDVPFFSGQFIDCYKVFSGLASRTYKEAEYKDAIQKLNQLVDDLKQTILLLDIFEGKESNLRIESFYTPAEYDVAERAAKFGREAPKELEHLEQIVIQLKGQQSTNSKEFELLSGKRMDIQTNKQLDQPAKTQQLAEIDKVLKPLREQLQSADDKIQSKIDEYKTLLFRRVKLETLKDLVQLARTDVGRMLLTAIAKTSFSQKNAKPVTINAYGNYKAADAGGYEQGSPYVNYTPQYFRDIDEVERGKEGAIVIAELLAKTNDWQQNDRTDISLFHELVHTYHIQYGTVIPSTELISEKEAVDPVDQPYKSETGPKGVRKEEYYTVGLGAYAKEPITENAYRTARQKLGEQIALRGYYTHKDAEGKPIRPKGFT